ncbi:hypothetical protein F3Y22_tig00112801pilonHSYRG00111 [Hibiscus syriacus]|uniref:Uncharacterized protein n=1 Tax=Hibiscus syriacus TaxID=106335 RepID=A0A6A2WSW2_HIBSY|nr:hypothetical protein F3Y22_tig00112801pilonHSYRG00111 [Hibiscus syriacus]
MLCNDGLLPFVSLDLMNNNQKNDISSNKNELRVSAYETVRKEEVATDDQLPVDVKKIWVMRFPRMVKLVNGHSHLHSRNSQLQQATFSQIVSWACEDMERLRTRSVHMHQLFDIAFELMASATDYFHESLNSSSRALLMANLDRSCTASSITGSVGIPVNNITGLTASTALVIVGSGLHAIVLQQKATNRAPEMGAYLWSIALSFTSFPDLARILSDLKLMYMDIVSKKHHPPTLGDEVWRLEKIGDHVVDPYPNHQQTMVRSFQQNAYLTDCSMEGYFPGEMQADGGNWEASRTYFNTVNENGVGINILKSNSEDDLTSPRSFIIGG